MKNPVKAPVIVWFREDLRLADNRALEAAAAAKAPVVAIYVHDEISEGVRSLGGASRWWLHHSLAALDAGLAEKGVRLNILVGAAEDVVPRLARDIGATLVTWSRRYGLAEREIDARIKRALTADGITAESFNDHLLAEPWELETQSGGPFRVYSPFWRALTRAIDPPAPLPAPKHLAPFALPAKAKPVALDALGLLPRIPWDSGLAKMWSPGEIGAHARLKQFIAEGLAGYAEGRDRIDRTHTSRLSPHLRFGEISPRQIWHAIRASESAAPKATPTDRNKLLAELGWREFAYHLLYHNPELATRNFAPRFDAFPWQKNAKALRSWQTGKTGIPIVDAGLRELWHTGYMHNRVRMITASFLIKHLLIDWRDGEKWFWDTLVDADPANNAASWQWVAGSGADAAPYFRVFNPVLQAAKFDPDGHYIKRWVPELAALEPRHLFEPWAAPPMVLSAAGITLGKTYPMPIVSLDQGRERALAAYAALPKT
ncbi:MAG: deoxyribodipyrimidine photo-lyase [Hyphomicrobiales bacterium]|nr:MAG: deoxyribodipyrimidine photo-lyase [Hyphomicrobiales bacterium]